MGTVDNINDFGDTDGQGKFLETISMQPEFYRLEVDYKINTSIGNISYPAESSVKAAWCWLDSAEVEAVERNYIITRAAVIHYMPVTKVYVAEIREF